MTEQIGLGRVVWTHSNGTFRGGLKQFERFEYARLTKLANAQLYLVLCVVIAANPRSLSFSLRFSQVILLTVIDTS